MVNKKGHLRLQVVNKKVISNLMWLTRKVINMKWLPRKVISDLNGKQEMSLRLEWLTNTVISIHEVVNNKVHLRLEWLTNKDNPDMSWLTRKVVSDLKV